MILYIETSGPIASVALSNKEHLIDELTNPNQQQHAGFLHSALSEILTKNGFKTTDLTAVSISNGPGSYTGLRVGLSAAKGLCYALKIPLIAVNTLEVWANKAKSLIKNDIDYHICTMIDARRMEVYTAIYNANIETLMQPQAAILDINFKSNLLAKTNYFCGSGAFKWQNLAGNNLNYCFLSFEIFASDLINITNFRLNNMYFNNANTIEPFYLKGIYDTRLQKNV